MYYQIEGDERTFYSAEDVVDYLVTTEYFEDDTDGFCEYIDESEGQIEILGYEWSASDVLREMDYDGFCREFEYWIENQVDNYKTDYTYELERLSHGQSIYICGYNVYAYDEEEEEDGEDTDGDEESAAMAMKFLELKLNKEKEEKSNEMTEQNKTADSFLSVLGVQII